MAPMAKVCIYSRTMTGTKGSSTQKQPISAKFSNKTPHKIFKKKKERRRTKYI